MTKKLFIVQIALLTGLLIFLSCNKESQKETASDNVQNFFSIADAKSWYVNHSSRRPNSASTRTGNTKINNFSPLWDKAIITGDDKYEIVECPLKFDKNPGFTISNTNNQNTTPNGITRLLILKNRNSGVIQSVLMHIYSNSGNLDEHITYSNREVSFSGNIFFTDLNGEFVNGWLYENGKIIKQSKRNNTTSNIAARALPPEEDCQTYETKWYERTCYYYTDGSTECTNWEYIGSTYQTYCSGGGGGGGYGGDVYDTKTLEEQLAEFDDKIEDSLTHDCLKTILQQILNLKNGKIGEIINQFSGDIPNWNWQLKEGTVSGAALASTKWPPFNGTVTTTFDYTKLNQATELSLARTMMHESVHAYLNAYFYYDAAAANKDYAQLVEDWITAKNPNFNDIQHDEMVRSFMNNIATSLKEFGLSRGYSLSDQFYSDMAWGGLTNTRAFSKLSFDDQDRISDRLNAELSSQTINDENPSGIKACN